MRYLFMLFFIFIMSCETELESSEQKQNQDINIDLDNRIKGDKYVRVGDRETYTHTHSNSRKLVSTIWRVFDPDNRLTLYNNKESLTLKFNKKGKWLVTCSVKRRNSWKTDSYYDKTIRVRKAK